MIHAIKMGAGLLSGLLLATMHVTAASQGQAEERTEAALRLDVYPQAGARSFNRYCQTCHGAYATGVHVGSAPVLAGQRFSYLVRQMANFASEERDSKGMHDLLVQPELRNPQTWVNIASYLNKAPIDRSTLKGDNTSVLLGRDIFQEQCASCHRADARGSDDGFVPSLRNQNYPYLVNQIHALANDRRHNIDEVLMRFMASFEPGDIHAVADYLSRLEGAGGGQKRTRDNGLTVD